MARDSQRAKSRAEQERPQVPAKLDELEGSPEDCCAASRSWTASASWSVCLHSCSVTGSSAAGLESRRTRFGSLASPVVALRGGGPSTATEPRLRTACSPSSTLAAQGHAISSARRSRNSSRAVSALSRSALPLASLNALANRPQAREQEDHRERYALEGAWHWRRP
jgi:hypothetical protein